MQDSTHIADDVITLGLTYKIARIEVSGFHGREPGENRWTISAGAIDSWSTRLTLNPAPNWSGQYSITRLKGPEQLFPAEDTLRMTSSITYDRPLNPHNSESAEHWGNWATTIIWGRNKDLPGGEIFNSYLAESTVRFAHRNFAWTRIENVDRTNELLLGEQFPAPGIRRTFSRAHPGLLRSGMTANSISSRTFPPRWAASSRCMESPLRSIRCTATIPPACCSSSASAPLVTKMMAARNRPRTLDAILKLQAVIPSTGFSPRRGAGVAEQGCLLSSYTPKGCRGFESPPLRHLLDSRISSAAPIRAPGASDLLQDAQILYNQRGIAH